MQIKGKQIKDSSLDLEKLNDGVKILSSTSVLGSAKTATDINNEREFTTKEYVDLKVDLSSTADVNLSLTGFGVSGTSGVVSYLGAFDFVNGKSVADVFINGVKVDSPEHAFFGSAGNGIPQSGQTLYFDLDAMNYDVEASDLVEVIYMSVSTALNLKVRRITDVAVIALLENDNNWDDITYIGAVPNADEGQYYYNLDYKYEIVSGSERVLRFARA